MLKWSKFSGSKIRDDVMPYATSVCQVRRIIYDVNTEYTICIWQEAATERTRKKCGQRQKMTLFRFTSALDALYELS